MNSSLNLRMGIKTSILGEVFESMLIKKSGHVIIFQILAQNIGDKPIKHGLIKCELPKYLKFHRITNEGSGNSFYSKISNSIVWGIPLLKQNTTTTLDFTAHVMPGMTSDDCIDIISRILEYQIDDYIAYEFDENSMAKIKLYKV